MNALPNINLQEKAKALNGHIEKYWFENKLTGLEKTLFHRIVIPFKPFDSGLEYEEQPISTSIVFEWLNLKLENPENLNNLYINHRRYPDTEVSIYVGCAHNICHISSIKINHIKNDTYKIEGELEVNFENEGVGKNEWFFFETLIDYK